MKAFRIFVSHLIVLIMLVTHCNGHLSEEKRIADDNSMKTSEESMKETNEEVIKDIESLENLAKVALKSRRGGFIVPLEDTEMLYEAMIHILRDLTVLIKDVNKAYTFLNAKGIDRIIAYNLLIPHNEVRINLLILTKALFEVTPIETSTIIPENIVDDLLDIFDNESNLALKAHALDILYLWLPKNPIIQARVMKLKGLEPFYNQISKLDISVVKTLLDLFNKILKEHISARNEKIQKTKADLDRLRLYQRIGLVERMSTPTVCNGLLDIFEVAWNFSNNDILLPVFEIIRNIKPFCMSIYGGNTKAVELFNALSEYVHNEENIEYLLRHDVNVTTLESIIQEYISKIKTPENRDEL